MSEFTVVVTEEESPFPPCSPWPLIYSVELPEEPYPGDIFAAAQKHEEEVLRQVAEERASELGGDPDEIRKGLKLHFAFAGGPPVGMDWREG